jgi:hypothetical protein
MLEEALKAAKSGERVCIVGATVPALSGLARRICAMEPGLRYWESRRVIECPEGEILLTTPSGREKLLGRRLDKVFFDHDARLP